MHETFTIVLEEIFKKLPKPAQKKFSAKYIFKNPDFQDLNDLKKQMRKDHKDEDMHDIRFIWDRKEDLYMWAAYQAIHSNVAKFLEVTVELEGYAVYMRGSLYPYFFPSVTPTRKKLKQKLLALGFKIPR